MSTKTIKLYNVLIDLKVDRKVAAEALDPILTRDEAFQVLATKEDMHRQTKWIISTFLAVALGQIAVLTGIMTFILSSAG
jgi:hypothetical protein